MNLLLLLLLFFAVYYGIKIANYAIDYYDFYYSLKVKNKERFKSELEKMYPVVGDIELDRYTLTFNTDRFNAPRLGEVIIVCGIEFKCIDLTDISEMDDHLRGNPIYEVCLFREDL